MSTYIELVNGKGRGVFTDKKIKRGDLIESSPIIEFPQEDWEYIGKTVLGVYCFFWGEGLKDGAMVLGYGSLYNHSYRPNAIFCRRFSEKVMDFIAIKDIEAGEEILINYNGEPDDHEPVWFDVVE